MTEDKNNTSNNENKSSSLFFVCAGIFAAALVFLIYSNISARRELNEYYTKYNQQVDINKQLMEMIENGQEESTDEAEGGRGTKESVPTTVKEKIYGVTLKENSPVVFDDLSYLTIPYYSFGGSTKIGHMIVNKEIADEVLDIFEELYNQLYPIQSMELAEDFDSLQTSLLDSTELASLGNNNTCALYYKPDSPHSYGLAIDVNPKINPAMSESGTAIPKNAGKYFNEEDLTDTEKWARITKESDIYKVFTDRGWKWGSENGGEPFCFIKELEEER